MRLPATSLSSLLPLGLLVALLLPPLASGRPLPADAPTRAVLRAEPPQLEPSRHSTSRAEHLAMDVPISPGTWLVYGSFSLVPLGVVGATSVLSGEKLWVTAAETAAGTVVGSVPGGMLFLQPAESGGRWSELDVAGFTLGMLLTPPIAALGTWGLGELAFEGSRDRGQAFLGALGGAAAGTLLGVIVHGVLEEVVGNRSRLMFFRKAIALGLIGSGATAGYQWAGGGPRERSH